MISKDFAKAQIARLAHMESFPWEDSGKRDLVDALMICEMDSTAIRIIDDIVQNARSGQKCPYAGDIRRMAFDRKTTAPQSSVCSNCQGDGFTTEWRIRWREEKRDDGVQMREKRADTELDAWDEANQMSEWANVDVYRTTVTCKCRKMSAA